MIQHHEHALYFLANCTTQFTLAPVPLLSQLNYFDHGFRDANDMVLSLNNRDCDPRNRTAVLVYKHHESRQVEPSEKNYPDHLIAFEEVQVWTCKISRGDAQ